MDGTGERRGLPRPTCALVFIGGVFLYIDSNPNV